MHLGRRGEQLLELSRRDRAGADQEHTPPGEVQEERKQHL